jgi:hypothetical protein
MQVNLTPKARIALIQELIKDYNDYLNINIDYVA